MSAALRVVFHAPLAGLHRLSDSRPPNGTSAAGAQAGLDPAALVAAVERSLDDLARQLERRLTEMSNSTMEMALTIASEVLGARVEAGALDLAPIVRRILDQAMEVDHQVSAIVHVSGADLTHLVERLGFEGGKQDTTRVRFQVDSTLPRGAVRVEAGKAVWSYDPRTVIERLRTECRGAAIS